MSVVNLINEQRLEMLNGCEVRSTKYEGVVTIRGNKVVQEGTVIDLLDSNKKVGYVWRRYVKEELGS